MAGNVNMDDWLETKPKQLAKTRPVYETRYNEGREWAAIRRFGDRYGRRPVKLPKFYHVDYAMMEKDTNKITSWVEVKCRENIKDKYPTLILSVHKVLSGIQIAKATNMGFVLFVEWVDYAGHVLIDDRHNFQVSIGGRYDRSDPQDVEPVFEIPISRFSCYKLT